MSGSSPKQMPTLRATNAVDAILDFLWRRFGPWLALIVICAGWLVGFGVATVGGLAVGRIAELSSERTLELVLAMEGAELVAWTCAVVFSVRPVRHWAEIAESGSADDLWVATVRLGPRLLRISAYCAYGLSGPLLGASVAVVAKPDIGFLVAAIVGIYVSLVYLIVTGSFLDPLAIRALLRGIGQPHRSSVLEWKEVGFGRRVAVAVPVNAAIGVIGGVWFGGSPGTAGSAMLWRTLVALAVVSLFGAVTAFFLTSSTLGPLRALIDGTERVKRGEYVEPVPELSADEFGILNHSFNEMLEGLAERRRLAVEVRESRSRIVAAADESRKRIERNIHDGAQQRLVALALDLRMAEVRASTLDPELGAVLRQAGDDLKVALAELRELARGLHPSILTTDGLGPAIDQLASRAPFPVVMDVTKQRFPEAVETACYFTVAEALANVAKYANATEASIRIAQQNGHVQLQVSDNGVGGADPLAGSGLTGLTDRIAALDGTLTVDSPIGTGTTLTVELPLPELTGTQHGQLRASTEPDTPSPTYAGGPEDAGGTGKARVQWQ